MKTLIKTAALSISLASALIFISCNSSAGLPQSNSVQPTRDYRIMFYNVENLFDIEDDPAIDDAEYLPTAEKKWTKERYQKKLDNIASVIVALGEGALPDVIGFAEIENRDVLEDLLDKTILKKSDYKIIHKDSPDERGIDVACLYRTSKVKPIFFETIRVDLGAGSRPTRDILYCQLLLKGADTLHFFVNHWPSRSGGEEQSAPKRAIAAQTVKAKVDQLLAKNPSANIILTGDFNDDPANNSLAKDLNAGLLGDKSKTLTNLTLRMQMNKLPGTLKYKGNWNYFDQFIVSKSFFDKKGLETSDLNYFIFSGPENNRFLLEQDTRYQGFEPFRTYHGSQFHDGYSDHLPVYVDLSWQK